MRLRRLAARVPVVARIAVVVALAALVAWPLGGWDTVTLTSRVIPTYDEGETLEGHRFDIALGDLRLSDTHPAGYDAGEDETYLILTVEVVNVSTETTGPAPLDGLVVADDPRLDGVSGSYYLAVDGTGSPELNPGLPRELEAVWTVDPGLFADGDSLHFRLRDSIPRKALLYTGTAWSDYFEAGVADRVVGG